MPNSLKTTTLPVDSLLLWIPKRQLLYEKSWQFLPKSHGKIFSFVVNWFKDAAEILFPMNPLVGLLAALFSFFES
tara:strand:- start:995 stop:1219 length:225 start_codon:yes stop_codon:yes gene_type:complete